MARGYIPPLPQPVHLGKFMLGNLRVCGVYFLWHKDELVYVGQTRVLQERLNQHLGERRKVFDAIGFIPCTIDELTKIESHFIRRFAPKYNNCGNAKMSRLAGMCRPSPKPTIDLGSLKFVPAEEITLNLYEMADALGVDDGDAVKARNAGLLPNMSLLDALLALPKLKHMGIKLDYE